MAKVKVPWNVKLAHGLLAGLTLAVVGTLAFAAWQEPEIRVLLLLFGVVGITFWAGLTVIEWHDKDGHW